MNVQN